MRSWGCLTATVVALVVVLWVVVGTLTQSSPSFGAQLQTGGVRALGASQVQVYFTVFNRGSSTASAICNIAVNYGGNQVGFSAYGTADIPPKAGASGGQASYDDIVKLSSPVALALDPGDVTVACSAG